MYISFHFTSIHASTIKKSTRKRLKDKISCILIGLGFSCYFEQIKSTTSAKFYAKLFKAFDCIFRIEKSIWLLRPEQFAEKLTSYHSNKIVESVYM